MEQSVVVPQNASEARATVKKALQAPGRPEHTGVGASLQDALMVATELVSNALKYAGRLTDFSVSLRDNRIVISVSDTSDSTPPARPERPAGATPGTWGWWMVHHLAHAVSVVRTSGGGKTVTASLPLA